MILPVWNFLTQILIEVSASKEAIFHWSPTLESLFTYVYWGLTKWWYYPCLNWWNIDDSVWLLDQPSKHTEGTVVIVPGINGSRKCHYVEQFIHEVAFKRNLAVVVIEKPYSTEYGNNELIKKGVKSLKDNKILTDTTQNFIIGYSAGSMPVIKYITDPHTNMIFDYAVCIACSLNLAALSSHISEQWSKALYWLMTSKWGKTIVQEDEERALSLGYTCVQDYYHVISCHNTLAKVRIPTHVICSYDDPLIDTETFAALYKTSSVNSFVVPVLSKKGGHLGWRCGSWLHHILLTKVFPTALNKKTL